jgi:proteasome lid subunit RPN8/RPN11
MIALTITSDAVATIGAEVAAWGAKEMETGGFLLAGDDRAITIVAHSGRTGIERHRDLFVVSGRALAFLFAYAEERDLMVVAQFHSHGRRAFLSRSDLRHGFGVDGFTTTVVPYYASPPDDITAWGWWIHRSGWQATEPPPVAIGSVRTIHFDEDGIGED